MSSQPRTGGIADLDHDQIDRSIKTDLIPGTAKTSPPCGDLPRSLEAVLGSGPLATLRAYVQLDHGKGTWAKVEQVQTEIAKLAKIRRSRVDVLADRQKLKALGLLRVFEVSKNGVFVQVLPAENWDLGPDAQAELSALISRRMGQVEKTSCV